LHRFGRSATSSASINSAGSFSDAVRAVAGLALFETGVHGRLAAADRVIALVLARGIAIYRPMMDYQFPKIAK
jgi:hypothetical protein